MVIFEQLFGLLFDAPKLAVALRFGRPYSKDTKGTQFADEFIRRFVVAGNLSRIAQSVSIFQRLRVDEAQSYLPEMCVTSRQLNVDAPTMGSFEKLPSARIHVQECDLYVFKNSASGKELQLYAMIAREVFETYENEIFIIMFIIV